MVQITIQVKNAELVGKGLANIRAEIPKISELTIKRAADNSVKRLKVYPPPPANSRYIRTYKLRDSMKVERAANGYTIKIDPVQKGRHYGVYVLGNAYGTGQARIHSGRWRLMRDVTEEEVKKLPPMVEDHVRMVARRNGL